VCGLLALAGALAADATLLLPYLNRRLPLPLMLVVVTATVVPHPLCDRFGGLEACLPRALLDRALAAAAVCSLALLACVPAGISAGGLFPWTPLLALMSVAVLAVTAFGPLAWLPALTLSLLDVHVELVYSHPVQRALDRLGVPALLLILLISISVYVRRGPRVR